MLRHIVRNLSVTLGRTLIQQKCAIGKAVNPYRLTSSLPVKEAIGTRIEDHELSHKVNEDDAEVTASVIGKVNQQIEKRNYGRLFAVVHLCGKQFKITVEDLLVLEGYWPPNVGDKINLKKILLVGGSDFTLIGRPILPSGLASIQATVVEKTMSHTKTRFRKKKRKQYMRINFHRSEYTVLRINKIDINENVNMKKDVEGLDDRLF